MSSCGLPCYDELKRMYLDGWTYQDLGAEFGCAKSTVFRVLKEGALARGEYPLRPALSRAERISRTQSDRQRDDLEDCQPFAIEIRSRLARFDGSTEQWCRQHGLRYPTVNEILRGAKPRVSPQLAGRLQAALRYEDRPALRLVRSPDAS